MTQNDHRTPAQIEYDSKKLEHDAMLLFCEDLHRQDPRYIWTPTTPRPELASDKAAAS